VKLRQPPRTDREIERLLHWMQAVITHPGGVEEGAEAAEARELDPRAAQELGSVVLPSRALSPAERLGIYSGMYVQRLLDCLREDHGALHHALGSERFEETMRAYVAAHPSTHFSLNHLGARLPEFMAGRGDKRAAFLSELARLERSMQEVFDAPQQAALAQRELLELPQERWPALLLRPIAALKLHAFHYPVNRYLQDVRDGRHPRIPAARPSWTLVYRKDYAVWRMTLAREQYELLRLLFEELALGEALETCAELPGIDAKLLSSALGSWFREWSAEGIFAAEG
jgi:hypothetical protein